MCRVESDMWAERKARVKGAWDGTNCVCSRVLKEFEDLLSVMCIYI